MALLDFIGNVIKAGAQAVGVVQKVTTTANNNALGVFNGLNSTPSSGGAGSLLVPQNSAGLGVWNTVSNMLPIATLVATGGKSKATVQVNPVIAKGYASIGNDQANLTQQIGLPSPTPAQKIQAASIVAGDVIDNVKSITQKDNSLLYLGFGLLAAKALKII